MSNCPYCGKLCQAGSDLYIHADWCNKMKLKEPKFVEVEYNLIIKSKQGLVPLSLFNRVTDLIEEEMEGNKNFVVMIKSFNPDEYVDENIKNGKCR